MCSSKQQNRPSSSREKARTVNEEVQILKHQVSQLKNELFGDQENQVHSPRTDNNIHDLSVDTKIMNESNPTIHEPTKALFDHNNVNYGPLQSEREKEQERRESHTGRGKGLIFLKCGLLFIFLLVLAESFLWWAETGHYFVPILSEPHAIVHTRPT
jgi:hypothetical protein